MKSNLVQWKMPSLVGDIYLVASPKGLCSVTRSKQKAPMVDSLSHSIPQCEILRKTVTQLEKYFVGQLKDFDLPFDIGGTPFQMEVWAALSKIPYGKTYSYKDIAAQIGRHKATRAVGTANGRNPLWIIVPCHRVIAADGTLGGYGGGLKMKSQLLQFERRGNEY